MIDLAHAIVDFCAQVGHVGGRFTNIAGNPGQISAGGLRIGQQCIGFFQAFARVAEDGVELGNRLLTLIHDALRAEKPTIGFRQHCIDFQRYPIQRGQQGIRLFQYSHHLLSFF